ncbi:histidine triad nucleotide-binding protein [bacterium]|nr:histidine triad nucleotide-binding protein [bacterium]
MNECLFCKIVKKEQPAKIVYEDDKFVAFKDIKPKAPIHFLIVPKKHIASIESEKSEEVAKELISVAKKIAKEKGIAGYKLVFNVGREGGQFVDHLHLHFLAGKPVQLP